MFICLGVKDESRLAYLLVHIDSGAYAGNSSGREEPGCIVIFSFSFCRINSDHIRKVTARMMHAEQIAIVQIQSLTYGMAQNVATASKQNLKTESSS